MCIFMGNSFGYEFAVVFLIIESNFANLRNVKSKIKHFGSEIPENSCHCRVNSFENNTFSHVSALGNSNFYGFYKRTFRNSAFRK